MIARNQDGGWNIRAAGLEVDWDVRSFAMEVRAGLHRWAFAPPGQDAVRVRSPGGLLRLPLRAGVAESWQLCNGAMEGVACRLNPVLGLPGGIDLELVVSVAVEPATGELVCTLDGRCTPAVLDAVDWPGAVGFTEPARQQTVIPFMQGSVIPGGWAHDIRLDACGTNSRGLSMPWWGQTRGLAGYLAILETDDDAGCRFNHPAGGPTVVAPKWDASLGDIAYGRCIRYAFFNRVNYVSMCKHYRRHVMARGRFVSLRQKIDAHPKVGLLRGCPVVHEGIARHIHPKSNYYDTKDRSRNDACVSFARRARQLEALKARGVERLYLHLDGWGVRGYDSHHPDYLPPNREAGGWAGLAGLSGACRRLGYLLALHDQYRDYYHNASGFDPENAIRQADGTLPYWSAWYGGPQSVLCARFAPAYVRRNHLALRDHGVMADGTYLDVFAIVPPDECYHPAHRVTRSQCLRLREACFHVIAELEGIASSEEPVDYAAPHLHLCHHGPYATDPWMVRCPLPVPAEPLWNLVYHDSLLLPWVSADTPGGWGIPPADRPAAHCALNGGMPYLDMEPSDAALARVRRLCGLHRRVALEEMVDHETLDESGTRQRARYSDGTEVTADLATGHWTAARP